MTSSNESSPKIYQCVRCGQEQEISTNHWDSIYKVSCKGCSSENPNSPFVSMECMDDPYGPSNQDQVAQLVGEQVLFDEFDADGRPIFISMQQDDIEYTIDKKGDVFKHSGFSDEKIGKIK